MITHLQRRYIPRVGDETVSQLETVGASNPIHLSDEFNLQNNPAVKVVIEREDGSRVEYSACGWSIEFSGLLTSPSGEQSPGRLVCDFYLDEEGQPKVRQFWREDV